MACLQLPPVSSQRARGVRRVANSAAEPPLEPPLVCVGL